MGGRQRGDRSDILPMKTCPEIEQSSNPNGTVEGLKEQTEDTDFECLTSSK